MRDVDDHPHDIPPFIQSIIPQLRPLALTHLSSLSTGEPGQIKRPPRSFLRPWPTHRRPMKQLPTANSGLSSRLMYTVMICTGRVWCVGSGISCLRRSCGEIQRESLASMMIIFIVCCFFFDESIKALCFLLYLPVFSIFQFWRLMEYIVLLDSPIWRYEGVISVHIGERNVRIGMLICSPIQ